MLVLLHCFGGDDAEGIIIASFAKLADRHSLVLIAPEGYGGRSWNGDAGSCGVAAVSLQLRLDDVGESS